jgi:hypothetical protein
VDWGTIEGSKVFIPNKRFLDEKDRWNDFIIPENLDLSKFEELKKKYKPGRGLHPPPKIAVCCMALCGFWWKSLQRLD